MTATSMESPVTISIILDSTADGGLFTYCNLLRNFCNQKFGNALFNFANLKAESNSSPRRFAARFLKINTNRINFFPDTVY